MKKTTKFFLFLILVSASVTHNYSQELKVENTYAINVDELPEYIVITSENTKLLGGINIIIDYKRSVYKPQLKTLEALLQDGDKLRVRNQTDLLNAMHKLGFEYVDAYNATTGTLGSGGGDDIEVFGSHSKFRTNMVFKKQSILKY